VAHLVPDQDVPPVGMSLNHDSVANVDGLSQRYISRQCIPHVQKRMLIVLPILLELLAVACGILTLVMNAKGGGLGIIDIVLGIVMLTVFAGM
jgi:hypothetical protein